MEQKKILIADDNVKNLSYIQDLLEGRGYEVAVARDGASAIKRVKMFWPDLILLDVMMPVLDGLLTCKALKEGEDTRHIPVIFTTALAREEQKVEGLKAGAVDYVTKPIAQEELLMRLEVHLKIADLNQALGEKNEALKDSNQRLREEIKLREKTEEQLIRSERFAAVGTFLQGIAHEFNNINNGIQGYADLAVESADKAEEVRELLGLLKRSIDKQSRIIDDLLSISGQSDDRKAYVFPQQVLEDALSIARFRLEKDGVELKREIEEGLEEALMDKDQIAQVLLNLILNACDAMVDVERGRRSISLSIHRHEGFIKYTVADHGCGIPPERQSKIFTPFFTTKGEFADDGSGQARIKGNGLGLSVCDKIIHRHGGRLELKSVVGEGTEFIAWLPHVTKAEERPDDEE